MKILPNYRYIYKLTFTLSISLVGAGAGVVLSGVALAGVVLAGVSRYCLVETEETNFEVVAMNSTSFSLIYIFANQSDRR